MTDEVRDDDVPWASPEIRQEYEAALGAARLLAEHAVAGHRMR